MNAKPSTLLLVIGGAVLALSTLLPWVSFGGDSKAGIGSFPGGGFYGIFCLLIGLAVAGLVAARDFGNVSLPDAVLSFTIDQIVLVLSAAAVLMTVGFVFSLSSLGFGAFLAVLAALAMGAGGIMTVLASPTPTSAAGGSPTPF